MLFSEYYKINVNEEQTWFDPNLKWDTPLFVDPILVFKNDLEEFSDINEKIKSFFDIVFKEVALVKGKPVKEWKKALMLLSFKETFETCLGYTNFGQSGSGIGPDFALKIFHSIVDFIDWGLEEFNEYLSPFELFGEGIGPDRISDMLSNIIKQDLIKYTQEICKRHKIPLKKLPIRNISFDKTLGWSHGKVFLPVNPINNKPIILVPKDFLRSESNEMRNFVDYLLHIENDDLRRQISSLITENISKENLRKVVSENKDFFKDLLKEYLEELKKERNPYDLRNDPSMLGEFKEILEKIKDKLPKFDDLGKSKESLKNHVENIISQFKRFVESKEGYYLLFNDDGKPRGERACQTFFWGIADTMCRQGNGPDISPESKTGKGLIDFKFSEGYNNKILVEIKRASNSKLHSGLTNQLPAYLESEEVDLGYYLVIKQEGGDNVRSIKLMDKYNELQEDKKEKIEIRIVDAYQENKKSASKL
jgi:hypothetical protein